MKFAHTEITIIAAITLQWCRWQPQKQQQSCQIGIDRISGFLVLAFFWRFFLAAWVFDLQLYWNFCGLVINSFSGGSSWKSSEIYIIFWALHGLPDELKVEQQYLGVSGCVCLVRFCVRVSHIFVTILFPAFNCADFALRLCGPKPATNPLKLDKHVNDYWHKKDAAGRRKGGWDSCIKSECVICVWIIRYTPNKRTKRDTTGNTNWHFICLSPADRRQTRQPADAGLQTKRQTERDGRRAGTPSRFNRKGATAHHKSESPSAHNEVIDGSLCTSKNSSAT